MAIHRLPVSAVGKFSEGAWLFAFRRASAWLGTLREGDRLLELAKPPGQPAQGASISPCGVIVVFGPF